MPNVDISFIIVIKTNSDMYKNGEVIYTATIATNQ